MANIVDYVRNAKDTFVKRPLSSVDSLVFSWLAYVRIPEEIEQACTPEGATLAAIGSQSNVLGLVAPVYDPRKTEELLRAVASSPRFADVVACHSVDTWSRTAEVQFSATTFLLPGDAGASGKDAAASAGAYLAFRGTDDSLVGWKENFNMAFTTVPAQSAATDYVNDVASQVEGPLWFGGHSKGGNLAVYALNTCEAAVRQRVVRCFSHDAPGFTDEARNAVPWAGADDLVEKTVPEESVIGLLFDNHSRDVSVVKSTNPGIMQHAPFSWVVENDDFAYASAVSYDAYRTNKRFGSWLATLDAASREKFVGVLYKLANATGEVTLSGIAHTLEDGSLDLALRRLDGLPAEERAFFLDKAGDLVATMLLGPAPTNPQTPTERADDAQDKVDDISARFDDRLSKLEKYGL